MKPIKNKIISPLEIEYSRYIDEGRKIFMSIAQENDKYRLIYLMRAYRSHNRALFEFELCSFDLGKQMIMYCIYDAIRGEL